MEKSEGSNDDAVISAGSLRRPRETKVNLKHVYELRFLVHGVSPFDRPAFAEALPKMHLELRLRAGRLSVTASRVGQLLQNFACTLIE